MVDIKCKQYKPSNATKSTAKIFRKLLAFGRAASAGASSSFFCLWLPYIFKISFALINVANFWFSEIGTFISLQGVAIDKIRKTWSSMWVMWNSFMAVENWLGFDAHVLARICDIGLCLILRQRLLHPQHPMAYHNKQRWLVDWNSCQ